MKILQVIETGGPGGAETIVATLSGALLAQGHEVMALTADGSWLPAELERRKIPRQLLTPSSGAVDFGLLRSIAKGIEVFGPDVVHAHLFQGALYAALAAAMTGTPCVVTLHGPADLAGRGLKHWIKQVMFTRTATQITAVSSELARAGEAALRLAPDTIRVVRNGVSPRHQHPIHKPVGSLSCNRLLAIGNIRPSKDYATLIQAVADLRSRGLDVHLDILGEPDAAGLYESLTALVDELGLAEKVVFRGFVADVSTYMSDASCLVLSSSHEGFSLAVVEAMLAGVPVVATRSGGPETIIEHGHSGLLVTVGDPAALASAIHTVLDDSAFAERLAQRAFQHASVSYSVDGMTTEYMAIYQLAAHNR